MSKASLDIEAELEQAERARLAGNEGQARVCARRAAGMAARVFLSRNGIHPEGKSAYTALQILAESPLLTPELNVAAHHLTTRLTEAFVLPMEADLIADARQLIGGLK
jgi:hypothetical protein